MTDCDHDHLIAQLLAMLAMLGWKPPGDVIAEIINGKVLLTSQALDACGLTKTTIHRWIKDADAKGQPLGVLSPAGYLIGLDRLLDYIETTQDRHERNKVERAAAKYADVWSQPLAMKKQGDAA